MITWLRLYLTSAASLHAIHIHVHTMSPSCISTGSIYLSRAIWFRHLPNWEKLSPSAPNPMRNTEGNIHHSPQPAYKNRNILKLLIPVNILIGQLPEKSLLEEYKLQAFEGVAEAIRSGNLRLFFKSLEENKSFFIKHRIYILVERMQWMVYRRLIKLTYATHIVPFLTCRYKMVVDTWPDNQHYKQGKIEMRHFSSTVEAALGEKVSNPQICMIFANLVSTGSLRAMVYPEYNVVAFHTKLDPFPNPTVWKGGLLGSI